MLTKQRNSLIKKRLNTTVSPKSGETEQKTAVDSFNAFYSQKVTTHKNKLLRTVMAQKNKLLRTVMAQKNKLLRTVTTQKDKLYMRVLSWPAFKLHTFCIRSKKGAHITSTYIHMQH
jgi:hypothetical protein